MKKLLWMELKNILVVSNSKKDRAVLGPFCYSNERSSYHACSIEDSKEA